MLDLRDYPELSAAFLARHPIDDPRFEPWLEAWYGAPVSDGFWNRDPGDAFVIEDREEFAIYCARSWSMGRGLWERFSTDQVGQTVWALLDQLQWPTLPERGERIMWDAVEALFSEVFEPYASGPQDYETMRGSEMGGALFMFWDVAGWRPERGTEIGKVAFLRIVQRGLASSHPMMQESALHGIGEYTPYGGEGTGAVPEAAVLARRFIAEGQTTRPELFEYAAKAAQGMVL